MDYIVYNRSDECNDYLSDNKPYKFKINLKAPLILKGFWTVALVEFYCSLPPKAPKNESVLHLFANICKESVIDGESKPILRRIQSSKKNQWMHSFFRHFIFPS